MHCRKDGVCNKQLEAGPKAGQYRKSGRPNFLVAAIKVLSERLPAVAANISGYYQVSGGVKRWGKGLPLPVNETALMEVLVKAGPVSIG